METERDCLDAMLSELQIQAGTLLPSDADARAAWLQACATVLAGIADLDRRSSAAMNLAICLMLRMPGLPSELALRTIMGVSLSEKGRRFFRLLEGDDDR